MKPGRIGRGSEELPGGPDVVASLLSEYSQGKGQVNVHEGSEAEKREK